MMFEQDKQGDSEALYEHYAIIVDKQQMPLRLDKFLMGRLAHTTRNKVQLAIQNHFIRVNQRPTKANYKVRPYDKVTVVLPTPPRLHEVVPENIPLDIVYEDEALLVVNKPAYMVVHPAHGHWTGTLVNALAYHFQKLPNLPGNEGRPGLVHRIDKGTSGLLVVAKTEAAMVALAKQFYDHTIERTYWALVWGTPKEDQGTIDINLGRSLQDRRIITSFLQGDQGKRAVTHYQVCKRLQYVSLVQCKLETGRTHQIRAHMRHLGHSLFGDERYGGRQIQQYAAAAKYKAFVVNCLQHMPYQALHAKTLGFVHPTTQRFMQFEAPLPTAFQNVLTRWEEYAKHYS